MHVYARRPHEKLRFTINENAKFADFAEVDGVRVVTDFGRVDKVLNDIRRLTGYLLPPMPINWPVTLMKEDLRSLETSPYVTRLKPEGHRYLLYVNSQGNIYMENNARNVFEFDEDHALQIVDYGRLPLKNTLLDGILTTPVSRPDSPQEKGRITFLIHDAIYCNGRCLKSLGVMKRVHFVKLRFSSFLNCSFFHVKELSLSQDGILKPRQHQIDSHVIDVKSEPFDIDIAEYEPSARAEKYLQDGFLDEQK